MILNNGPNGNGVCVVVLMCCALTSGESSGASRSVGGGVGFCNCEP